MKQEMYLAILVFLPFAAGLLCYLAGRVKAAGGCGGDEKSPARDCLAALFSVAEFAVMTTVLVLFVTGGGQGKPWVLKLPGIWGFGLSFTLDGFRALYGCIAAFLWMMASLLSVDYMKGHSHQNRYYLFLLWTLGATMGVFFSASLDTTFLFFEIMSFTSYVWVAQEENKPALRAADTYLGVAVTGGLVMLMGIFLLKRTLGTLTISQLSSAAALYGNKTVLYAAGGCLLVGFGAKAGAFPLHIWLPKAHPVAPAPASALLSGILTKTGIYGTLIVSCTLFWHDAPWGRLLLAIGVITMVGGALLAVFSVDLKRTLACSSMSQIGFILVGIGMQGLLGEENAAAVHGTFLHMVNHSLIKLVLFLAAGVVFMNAHNLDLNRIRGFGRKKPFLAGVFLVGALAIGGIPLFGGYISKTLLHESILEYGEGFWIRATEFLFLFSGGMTVAYMTKLFAAVFVEKNGDEGLQRQYDGQKRYVGIAGGIALGGSALALLLFGLFPKQGMDRAAELSQGFMGLEKAGEATAYFSLENLKGAAVSIAIGALVYGLVIRGLLMRRNPRTGVKEYVDRWPAWLDLENLIYRPLFLKILPGVFGVACRILDSFTDTAVVLLRKTLYRDSPLPRQRKEGNAFTEFLGKGRNLIQALGNLTVHRQNPRHRDYVHLAAMKGEALKESNLVIQRSLSFGLLLFCVGLGLTLVFLIFI